MGGEQAGKVLRIVAEQKNAKMGQTADPAMLDALEQHTAQKMNQESTALFGTARIWDDGLMDPRDTRTLLGFLLEVCEDADLRVLKSTTFGVARL